MAKVISIIEVRSLVPYEINGILFIPAENISSIHTDCLFYRREDRNKVLDCLPSPTINGCSRCTAKYLERNICPWDLEHDKWYCYCNTMFEVIGIKAIRKSKRIKIYKKFMHDSRDAKSRRSIFSKDCQCNVLSRAYAE